MKKRVLNPQTKLYNKLPTWFYVILVCLQVMAFFFLGVILLSLVLSIFLLPFAFSNEDIFSQVLSNQYVELSLFAAPLLLLFAWVKWVEKRPLSSLGFYKEKGLSQFAKGWGIGLTLFVLSIIVTSLLGGSRLEKVDFSLQTVAYSLSTIPFWILQGGTEEVLTRGWLLPVLNRRLPLAWAVGISGTLFGLMHLANPGTSFIFILQTVLAGIMMGLYFLKTDNIWGVIGLHGAWNFASNLFGLDVEGSFIFSLSNKSEIHDMVTCVLLFLVIVWLVYGLRKEKNQKKES